MPDRRYAYPAPELLADLFIRDICASPMGLAWIRISLAITAADFELQRRALLRLHLAAPAGVAPIVTVAIHPQVHTVDGSITGLGLAAPCLRCGCRASNDA